MHCGSCLIDIVLILLNIYSLNNTHWKLISCRKNKNATLSTAQSTRRFAYYVYKFCHLLLILVYVIKNYISCCSIHLSHRGTSFFLCLLLWPWLTMEMVFRMRFILICLPSNNRYMPSNKRRWISWSIANGMENCIRIRMCRVSERS